MSYCRMENTYNDLSDAYNHLDDTALSESETEFRDKIIKLASRIHNEYAEEVNEG